MDEDNNSLLKKLQRQIEELKNNTDSNSHDAGALLDQDIDDAEKRERLLMQMLASLTGGGIIASMVAKMGTNWYSGLQPTSPNSLSQQNFQRPGPYDFGKGHGNREGTGKVGQTSDFVTGKRGIGSSSVSEQKPREPYTSSPPGAPPTPFTLETKVSAPQTPSTTAGGSRYLASTREKYFAELDRDPQLREEVMKTASKETSREGRTALIESMVNRAQMNGYTSLRQAVHDGFYGPVNRGALNEPLSQADREAGERAIANVRGGSNQIEYRTDQGMWSDPNGQWYKSHPEEARWKNVGGENYFDYRGKGPSWAKQQMANEAEYNRTHPITPPKPVTPVNIPHATSVGNLNFPAMSRPPGSVGPLGYPNLHVPWENKGPTAQTAESQGIKLPDNLGMYNEESLKQKIRSLNGHLGDQECVTLARGIVNDNQSVKDWRRGENVMSGNLPLGTPISTFMDRKGNPSELYDGGQGVGAPGNNTTHAAVFAGYERNEKGDITGIKVYEQYAGSKGIQQRTYSVEDERGGEKAGKNYYSINDPKGNPLGGDKNPITSRSQVTGPTGRGEPMSDVAVGMIKSREGFSPTRYFDITQNSIGYGSKARPGDEHKSITKEEGVERLKDEVRPIDTWIDANITQKMTTNQRAALTSFGYNVGTDALARLKGDINAGDWSRVYKRMATFNKVMKNGQKEFNQGIYRRRLQEIELANTPDGQIPKDFDYQEKGPTGSMGLSGASAVKSLGLSVDRQPEDIGPRGLYNDAAPQRQSAPSIVTTDQAKGFGVGVGTALTRDEIAKRPAHELGMLSVNVPGQDKPEVFDAGSGGWSKKGIPPGRYVLSEQERADRITSYYNRIGAPTSMNNEWGKVYNAGVPGSVSTIPEDPGKFTSGGGGDRNGIQIHAGSDLQKLMSEGCVVVDKSQYPRLVQAIEAVRKANDGKATLVVDYNKETGKYSFNVTGPDDKVKTISTSQALQNKQSTGDTFGQTVSVVKGGISKAPTAKDKPWVGGINRVEKVDTTPIKREQSRFTGSPLDVTKIRPNLQSERVQNRFSGETLDVTKIKPNLDTPRQEHGLREAAIQAGRIHSTKNVMDNEARLRNSYIQGSAMKHDAIQPSPTQQAAPPSSETTSKNPTSRSTMQNYLQHQQEKKNTNQTSNWSKEHTNPSAAASSRVESGYVKPKTGRDSSLANAGQSNS